MQVGQNVYQSSSSRIEDKAAVIRKAVQGWYDEVQLFDNSSVDRYRFSSNTGHYTAIAWAKTDKVGCGSTSYQERGFTHSYMVCNYGPAGNFQGSPMYKTGTACSACPPGTSCTPGGLCSAKGGSPVQQLQPATSTAAASPQQLPTNVVFDPSPFR